MCGRWVSAENYREYLDHKFLCWNYPIVFMALSLTRTLVLATDAEFENSIDDIASVS